MDFDLSLPATLNVEARLIVVIGAGRVACRKVRSALEAGAVVRVVSLEASPPAGMTHPRVIWVQADYHVDHLEGAALVFAAATAEVNARVVEDARERGVWVSSATDPNQADFSLPAVGRLGSLTLAVSTGGAAPALARRLRDRLLQELDGQLAEWLEVLAELRPEILAGIPEESERRRLLDEFSDWPWLERLKREGREATLAAMREITRGRRGA